MQRTHCLRVRATALFCAAIFMTFGVQSAQALTEDFKLIASDGAADDRFGVSVSLLGDTMIVGALYDDEAGTDSGSAYVFTRSGGVWVQQAKLVANDAAAGDHFGGKVFLSGGTAFVGASLDDGIGTDSGSVYIFTYSGGIWIQQQKLTANDASASDMFGVSISVSGNTALVGAYGNDDAGSASGSAYVFTRSGEVWTQQTKLMASDAAKYDYFGLSVSLSGDTALVGVRGSDDGGTDSGSAYIFTRSGGVWTQQQKLVASDAAAYDNFGISVALDADIMIIGAPFDGEAVTHSAGSAYVFMRSGGVWTQQQKLVASDAAAYALFCKSVVVSGDTALIGSNGGDGGFDSGSVYVFTRIGGVWTQQTKLVASDAAWEDYFGGGVSFSGDTAIIGAVKNDGVGIDSGSAYVFDLAFLSIYHSADQIPNHVISLSELLRVIQLFHLGSLHCDAQGEDGFNPGSGDITCTPHTSDYNPQDWNISFGELLRLIQLFNSLRYYSCPGVGEDGFCPGTP